MFDETFHDAAEDYRASEPPVYPVEDFRDLLRRIILGGGHPAEVWARAEKMLAEFDEKDRRGYDAELALVEMLRRFVASPSPLLDAHCQLWLLNKNPLSIVAVAKLLKITKAAVSKRKNYWEDFYQIKSRCGRSDEAHDKFARITRARGKRKTKGTQWNWPHLQSLKK